MMQNGLSDERLEASLVGSPEYYMHAGNTNKAWVDQMYLDLLNRAADPQGEQAWLTALQNGAQRIDIAYGFAASAEREGIRVRADYQTFLNRSPSQSEVDAWVQQFESGRAVNEDVVAGFAASQEYFLRHLNNSSDWLLAVYHDILNRSADDAGYAASLAYLYSTESH